MKVLDIRIDLLQNGICLPIRKNSFPFKPRLCRVIFELSFQWKCLNMFVFLSFFWGGVETCERMNSSCVRDSRNAGIRNNDEFLNYYTMNIENNQKQLLHER